MEKKVLCAAYVILVATKLILPSSKDLQCQHQQSKPELQVTLNYPEAARPDMALVNYGFLPPSAEDTLSAVDLPPLLPLQVYDDADHGAHSPLYH